MLEQRVWVFPLSCGFDYKSSKEGREDWRWGVLVTLDWPGSVFLLKVEEKVRERDCVVEEEGVSQNDLP